MISRAPLFSKKWSDFLSPGPLTCTCLSPSLSWFQKKPSKMPAFNLYCVHVRSTVLFTTKRNWTRLPSTIWSARPLTIGSLSTHVFETRTATGSELFSLLTCFHTTTFTLLGIFSPLEMISTKIWETPLSWHVKCSLPVAVRVSKTLLLKLPYVAHHLQSWSIFSHILVILVASFVMYWKGKVVTTKQESPG